MSGYLNNFNDFEYKKKHCYIFLYKKNYCKIKKKFLILKIFFLFYKIIKSNFFFHFYLKNLEIFKNTNFFYKNILIYCVFLKKNYFKFFFFLNFNYLFNDYKIYLNYKKNKFFFFNFKNFINKLNFFLNIYKKENFLKNYTSSLYKIFLIKNFQDFYYFWDSKYFILNKKISLRRDEVTPTEDYWPIFDIDDDVVRFRLNIDNDYCCSNIYFTKYFENNSIFFLEDNDIELNSSFNYLENKANYLKKRKKENEEQKIKKEERIKKFTLLRENSKIKIKKREDDLLILKKEIYNSVIGRRFSFSDKFLNKIISKGVIDFKTRMEDKKLSLNEKIFLSKILENYTFNKEFFQLIYLFLIFLIQKKSFKNFHLIVILFTFLKKKKLKYLYKNFDIFCLDDKNDTYLLDFNYLVEFREMYFKLFHNNFFYKRESFFNIFKILREGYNFKKTLWYNKDIDYNKSLSFRVNFEFDEIEIYDFGIDDHFIQKVQGILCYRYIKEYDDNKANWNIKKNNELDLGFKKYYNLKKKEFNNYFTSLELINNKNLKIFLEKLLKKEDFYINNLKTIEKNTFKKFLFLKIQENYLFNLKIKVDFNLYLKNKSIYDNLFILFDLHELDFYNYLILLKNNLIKEGGLNFNYKNSFILNEKIIPKKILSFLKNSIKKTQNLNNSIILNSRSNFKKRRTYVSENNFNYFLTLKYSDIYLKNIFFLKNFLKNSLENLENLKKNYLFYKKKNYFINKCSFHNNLKKKFNLNFFNISELFIYRQKNSKIDNLLNFNNNLEPYIENSEIRDNFLSINFLLSNSIQNSQKIFYFCDINIFFNIKFFFNYLNEYFLLKILFFKNNNWKWLKLYFSPNTFTLEEKMFLNLKKIYFSNIINPLNFSNYHYKIIIFNSKKNKMKNISKNIFKIILKFLNKFLFKNYYIILQKINFSNINKNLQNKVFSLLNERSFELIRPNFLSEFIGISMSTFLTKDPKFLLEWLLKNLRRIHYRKQWKFLYQFKNNITKIAKKFILKTKFLGIHIIIKGKIGALGCVRKKIFHIKVGTFGFSRFYLKGDELFSYAGTQTGKIGIKIITCYK